MPGGKCTREVADVDKVEGVSVGPRTRCVVDLKCYVRRGVGWLIGRYVCGYYRGEGVEFADSNCPLRVEWSARSTVGYIIKYIRHARRVSW